MVSEHSSSTHSERPTEVCGVGATLQLISGKWKPLILWHLRSGPMRYGELRTAMPDVSDKVLSQQLRDLESGGLIERSVTTELPLTVTYATSAEGQTVNPVLDAMAEWGMNRILRNEGESPGCPQSSPD